MQNVDIHKISSEGFCPFADHQQLHVAAIIQSEHLRAVGIVPTALVPQQRVVAVDRVFHLDILSEVKVVLNADAVHAAEVVGRQFDEQILLHALVTFIEVAALLAPLGRRLERHILVLERRDHLFPHRNQAQVLVGHHAGVVILLSPNIAPADKAIAFPRRRGQAHHRADLELARRDLAVAAVDVKGHSVGLRLFDGRLSFAFSFALTFAFARTACLCHLGVDADVAAVGIARIVLKIEPRNKAFRRVPAVKTIAGLIGVVDARRRRLSTGHGLGIIKFAVHPIGDRRDDFLFARDERERQKHRSHQNHCDRYTTFSSFHNALRVTFFGRFLVSNILFDTYFAFIL